MAIYAGAGSRYTYEQLVTLCSNRTSLSPQLSTFYCDSANGWPVIHFFIGFFGFVYLPAILPALSFALLMEVLEWIILPLIYPTLMSVLISLYATFGQVYTPDTVFIPETSFGTVVYDIAIQSVFGIACAWFLQRSMRGGGAYPTPYFSVTTGMSRSWTRFYTNHAQLLLTTLFHVLIAVVVFILSGWLPFIVVPAFSIFQAWNLGLLIWGIVQASLLLLSITFFQNNKFFLPVNGIAGASVWTRYTWYTKAEPGLFAPTAQEVQGFKTRRFIYVVLIIAHIGVMTGFGLGFLVPIPYILLEGVWIQLISVQVLLLAGDVLLWALTSGIATGRKFRHPHSIHIYSEKDKRRTESVDLGPASKTTRRKAPSRAMAILAAEDTASSVEEDESEVDEGEVVSVTKTLYRRGAL